MTTGEKKVAVTKGDLLKQIEAIKKLLENEYLMAHQEADSNTDVVQAHYESLCEFISYLQDQVGKITGGLE